MNQQKTLEIESLTPMDMFTAAPLRIDLAYAQGDNVLFGEQIYRADARLWLHEDLAAVVVLAATLIHRNHGLSCILYDGLRTIDAQQSMLETQRVQDNPHWLEEPRLLSPPGAGAHPRAMAIDISLEDARGQLLDMGTPFDDLTEKAHRDYPHHSQVMDNRKILDDGMGEAAKRLNFPLLALPQEWWDFRADQAVYENYDPLCDSILPPQMRLIGGSHRPDTPDFDAAHFNDLRDRVMERVNAQL